MVTLFFKYSNSFVMVCARVRKEFEDMRVNEQTKEFIRVGDTVRTVEWLKGELMSFLQASS